MSALNKCKSAVTISTAMTVFVIVGVTIVLLVMSARWDAGIHWLVFLTGTVGGVANNYRRLQRLPAGAIAETSTSRPLTIQLYVSPLIGGIFAIRNPPDSASLGVVPDLHVPPEGLVGFNPPRACGGLRPRQPPRHPRPIPPQGPGVAGNDRCGSVPYQQLSSWGRLQNRISGLRPADFPAKPVWATMVAVDLPQPYSVAAVLGFAATAFPVPRSRGPQSSSYSTTMSLQGSQQSSQLSWPSRPTPQKMSVGGSVSAP